MLSKHIEYIVSQLNNASIDIHLTIKSYSIHDLCTLEWGQIHTVHSIKNVNQNSLFISYKRRWESTKFRQCLIWET